MRSRVEWQLRNSSKNLVWVSKGEGRRRKKRDRWREHLRFVGLLCQLSCFGLQPLHAAGKQIKDAVNISGCVGFLLHSVCSSAQRKGFQISSTLLKMLFISPNWPLIHTLWLLPSDSACQCAVVCHILLLSSALSCLLPWTEHNLASGCKKTKPKKKNNQDKMECPAGMFKKKKRRKFLRKIRQH